MRTPQQILNDAVEAHDPVAVFGLFSGGFDSLAATNIAAEHPRFTAAVHINTGIGIEETRSYVRSTAALMGWPLIEKSPPPGSTYQELVLRYGFPGPSMHSLMYRHLKERAVRELVREHKRERLDRVLLVTGVRSSESVRRMGNVQEVKREDARVWVAPILRFSKLDVRLYAVDHGLPQNAVANNLHMSGECLCGCFARPGELERIADWYPGTAERIRTLESEVRASGQSHNVWGWGGMKHAPQDPIPGFLCSSCGLKGAE